MRDDEIRIVRASDGSQIVVIASLLRDHAAVRRAHILASGADLMEVWRGMTCDYSTVPDALKVH
jgi:hypothetical protein